MGGDCRAWIRLPTILPAGLSCCALLSCLHGLCFMGMGGSIARGMSGMGGVFFCLLLIASRRARDEILLLTVNTLYVTPPFWMSVVCGVIVLVVGVWKTVCVSKVPVAR